MKQAQNEAACNPEITRLEIDRLRVSIKDVGI